MKSIYGLIAIAFSATSFSPCLHAENATTTLIGYLHHDAHDITAAEFAARLDPRDRSFDRSLSQSLQSPIHVYPLARPLELPPHLHVSPFSSRWFLDRYVVLEYPVVVRVDSLRETLKARSLFGYLRPPTEGAWAAVPADPYYPDNNASTPRIPEAYRSQRWFFEMMKFPGAWDIATGHSVVGMLDTGIDITHPEFEHSLRLNQSWSFDTAPEGHPDVHDNYGHGTHTSGLVAARAHALSGEGVASTCWDCGIAMARIDDYTSTAFARAGVHLLDNGVQLINFSGSLFLQDPSENCPHPQLAESAPESYAQAMAQADPFCAVVAMAWERDVPLISVANNYAAGVEFPASAPSVIAVGGVEADGLIWNDEDEPGGCPPGICGSGTGPEQDFVAPAKHVLSTFPAGRFYNHEAPCTDDPQNENFLVPGYDYCTGTSMSGPLVSGALALVRSTHPTLSAAKTEEALRATASNHGVHDDVYGYGIPDVGTAIRKTTGTSNGTPIANRLSPMFVLGAPYHGAALFTSAPQVAAAALVGRLYSTPAQIASTYYESSPGFGRSINPPFAFPLGLDSDLFQPIEPRAAFWLFTTPHNPFGDAPLIPLYRLSTRRGDSCLLHDSAYATDEAGIQFFLDTDLCTGPDTSRMVRQGIEGYLLPDCPANFTCLPENRAQEGGLQCVYLRRRAGTPHMEDWALVLEDELPGAPDTPYAQYTATAPGMEGCLGYAFIEMHSDGDTLNDGIEFMLGTDPHNADTDGDCRLDSQEYPAFDLPASDPRVAETHDPLTCDSIFAFDNEL